MRPGAVHELRITGAGRLRVISGFFDSPEKMAAAALELDGKYPAVYLTLNPVNPALLARACNRVIPYAELTTSDRDIEHRQCLLIDCDPKRPSGISSTNAEHDSAIATAYSTRDGLRADGWPEPVVADSGNGGHLLYWINAPNTPLVTARVQRALKSIAARYATGSIAIDITVHNAARITKLYGTLVKKGDDMPERPHRRSRLLEVPAVLCELEGVA
jgi:hypothetical protein